MSRYRKTAIVELVLASTDPVESLPLTTEREFGVLLRIEGVSYPAGTFHSPLNDEQWRDFVNKLRSCNRNHSDTSYRDAVGIRQIGLALYKTLAGLSVPLRQFLDATNEPRRLVIQTTRPELHLLPWGALYDLGGSLLAAGDLSIVQSWDPFSDSLAVTASQLQLRRIADIDTSFSTGNALKKLPPEIVWSDGASDGAADGATVSQDAAAALDILHVEAHGDAVTNRIGDVGPGDFGDHFGRAKMALLWSCYSSAANSWGDSPALCLHRAGVAMVLSFQAELHVLDAGSIAESFYGQVFGPAASRDPETALVKVRAEKFANEFAYANWASMTVYLRRPLDLSALPLNGPRVPASGWIDAAPPTPAPAVGVVAKVSASAPAESSPANTTPAAAADPWAEIANTIAQLQPGTLLQMESPDVDLSVLPRSGFGGWRGNVIRLDGGVAPLTNDLLRELDLQDAGAPSADAAERLVWFFERISTYGSPLIVWTNAADRHMEFLKQIDPDPALTFLLLTGSDDTTSVPELVDRGELARAREVCAASGALECTDEVLAAAYYACVRGEDPKAALEFLNRLSGLAEWLLLVANYLSRGNDLTSEALQSMASRFVASGAITTTELSLLHRQEDFYRLIMNQAGAGAATGLRDLGRAKHELAYLMQGQGRPGTAELLFRLALADLDKAPPQEQDSRWHFALPATLRDLADLLSGTPTRLHEASALLDRAMAIQSFHGMKLQLAYSKTTEARIALTARHERDAIHAAVDAANRMETCQNWRGWADALGIFFDCLAETRETKRMLSLADLAVEKLQLSNLSEETKRVYRRVFSFERARAHWIAGEFAETREELEKLETLPNNQRPRTREESAVEVEIARLRQFLRL